MDHGFGEGCMFGSVYECRINLVNSSFFLNFDAVLSLFYYFVRCAKNVYLVSLYEVQRSRRGSLGPGNICWVSNASCSPRSKAQKDQFHPCYFFPQGQSTKLHIDWLHLNPKLIGAVSTLFIPLYSRIHLNLTIFTMTINLALRLYPSFGWAVFCLGHIGKINKEQKWEAQLKH